MTNTTIALIPMTAFVILSTRPDISHPPILSHAYFYTLQPPVLKSPLPWSTDILRLAFTYLVFWGAAWCVREKEHLNVDVLLMSFPVKIRKVVELGIDLVLSLFFIFMIVFGILA